MTTPVLRLRSYVEQRAAQGSLEPLDLADLGGLAEVIENAAELALDVYAPFAAGALLRAGQPAAPALVAFVRALRQQPSPLALIETIDALLGDLQAVASLGGQMHDDLLPLPADQREAPALAAIRLEACVRLVLMGAKPAWSVVGLLAGAGDVPPEHQQRLPRLIGALLDRTTQEPTPDGNGSRAAVPAAAREALHEALERLAAAGNADAAVELAAQALRDALSEDPASSRDSVQQAVLALEDAAGQEERHDAAALAQAGRALIALHDRDAGAVRAAAEQAIATAATIGLHLRGMHTRSWTSERRSTQVGWLTFAGELAQLADELEHDAFLDTSQALLVVGNVYAQARAVSPAGPAGSTIVRARIEQDVAARAAMTRQLERAITIDAAREQPLLPAGASLLAEALHGRQARTASTDSHSAAASEGGDDDPEPAGSEGILTPADISATGAAVSASADSPLRTLLGAPRMEELLAEHPEALAGMELMAAGLLAGDLAGLLADTDPILDQLDALIVTDLEQNDAFSGMVAVHFTRLARFTVRFVKYTLDTGAPYLRQHKTREDAPHEVELQQHFAGWLALYLPEQYLEVPKIGTGRSDVVTPFGGGHTFITEVKREFDDVTKAGLEAKYLAQAANYQVTRPPLGGLMTLDLTSHSGISPHLLDLVWVAHRKVDGGSVTRSVLCSVVLGNRPSPSQTR